MFEGKHIQVGAGRYIQCHGALKRAERRWYFSERRLTCCTGTMW